MMEDGEDAVVAERLRAVLSAPAARRSAPPQEPPAVDISGDWRVHLRFVYGEAVHALHAQQSGAEVQGTYRTQYEQRGLSGRVAGREVMLRGRYALVGTVDGDTMSGTAHVGQEWPAQWTAQREKQA